MKSSNEGTFPPAICERIRGICVGERFPAYLQADEKGVLTTSGGACERYGLKALTSGMPVADECLYMLGVVPHQGEPFCLPLVQTGDEVWADLHVYGEDGLTTVVFLDATHEAKRLYDLQQNAHELDLLRDAQDKTLAKLSASHEDCLAILDRLELVTAIVGVSDQVEFLSKSGRERFCADGESGENRPWEDVLPFDHEQNQRIRRLLESPPEGRRRLRLPAQMPSGRRYCFDVDVQDDPRGEGKHILFLYDTSELYDLRELLDEKAEFYDLVGRSEPMTQVFRLIRDIAGVDATVLVEGETGTGKELVARALHFSSHRKDGPFIVVNCAGLSDSLINSQLFGHCKGAFTDAVRDQQGLFEAANGGTIFLDEIGDIPVNAQTRILRVLENREVTRLGESVSRSLDIRVLVATNKDLQEEVDSGRFRLDLLYRIRVARIRLPPLRERREDIPLLIAYFLGRSATATGKKVDRVSDDAMQVLLDCPWIGNVRELRNAVDFAALRCRGEVIVREDLPPEITSPRLSVASRRPYALDEERKRILNALEKCQGNRREAAKLLGISRATFYRRLRACFPGTHNLP